MKKNGFTNILVVKNRAMGDAIISLSTIQYLKTIHPKARITYLTPQWVCPLFSRVETAADNIIGFKLDKLANWWRTYRKIREIKPDCIFEMFQSGRTKKFFQLYSKIHNVPYYFHNHHTKSGIVHDQGVIKSNIQRDLDGAWTYFDKGEIPKFIDYPPVMKIKNKGKNQIIFGVVATRKTKIWPLEFYAKLSKKLNKPVIIPLSKSLADQEIKRELISHGIQGEFLEVGLDELPVHLAGSSLYIGNDTGLKHLCVALGIPTFTMFGPEPPTEWHPYDPTIHPYYFREGLECRTRTAHYCGLNYCDEMICLNQFNEDQLLLELSKQNMI